jgi:hypothetical protein
VKLFEDDEAIRAGIEADIAKELARVPKRLSRTGGPSTSVAAAKTITRELASLHRAVIDMVRAHPGKTAAELAVQDKSWDSRRIGRRLPELEELGYLRRGEPRACTVTGRKAHTWWESPPGGRSGHAENEAQAE